MADSTTAAVPCDGTLRAPPAWLLSGQAFFAGWLAGGAGVLAGHPFDTIKTLQQTQTTLKTSPGIVRLFKSVWTQHGIRGLFKGVTYPLVTYGAVNAAFFCAAEYSRNFMVHQGWGDETGRLSYTHIILVGSIGGVAQIPIVCPTELVKIKIQDQINTGKRQYTGSIDCTIKLWRAHGVTGFFRGLSACSIRDVYAWGFYLMVFEFIRDNMSDKGFHYITSELLAGGLAGFGSWAIATPLDVVKSRMQASEHKLKFIPVVKCLYAEEGWRAFTRGMLASSIRGFPANAVTLCGFAELMRCFTAFNNSYYS